jgi:hypothetical protein
MAITIDVLGLVFAAWLGQFKTVFHAKVNRCEKHGCHEQCARHENSS